MAKAGKKKKTLAETLRDAVHASGESVARIARQAGIAQPVLHRFVSGERDLTLRVADRLAAHFGLSLKP